MESLTLYQPSAAVLARREMVNTPAVISALDIVERAVLCASIERPISQYTSTELAAELDVALKWISKDIGYRVNDISDKQYLVIRTAEILNRYYPAFTMKDFRLAFEMCITGELDEYLPRGRDGQPDRGHYQQFNAEYLCKVLNAYKSRRYSVLKKATQAAPKKEPVRDAARDARNAKAVRRMTISAFLHFKYRGRLPELSLINEIVIYNELVSVGLADELEMSGREQKAALDSIIGGLARPDSGGRKDSFTRTRRRMLEEAFSRIVEDELQITDYLKYGN